MITPDLTNLAWRKSRRSSSTGSDCVEVAATQTVHLARDSKDREGPVLSFTRPAWSTFLDDIKQGVHDL